MFSTASTCRRRHHADQSPVTKPDDVVGINGLEQSLHLIGVEDGCEPFGNDMLWSPYSMCWIVFDDLANNEPIEEHPDGCQVLLDRGGRFFLHEEFDIGRDMKGLNGFHGES